MVDFPTPPLQDDTAMMDLTLESPNGTSLAPKFPPICGVLVSSSRGGWDVMVTATRPLVHAMPLTAFSHNVWNSSLMGHAGVVSSTSKDICRVSSLSWMFCMNPNVTMSRLKSGSMMEERDWSISPFHSVGIGIEAGFGDSIVAVVVAALSSLFVALVLVSI